MFCFNLNILYTYIYTYKLASFFFLCTLCFAETSRRPRPRTAVQRRNVAIAGQLGQKQAPAAAAPTQPHKQWRLGRGRRRDCRHTWVCSSAGGSDVITISSSEALMLYLIYCEGRVKIYFSIRNFPSVSGGWCMVLLLQLLSLFWWP